MYHSIIVILFQLLGEPGSGGSSTPSMVGAVKKWQKSDPQNSLETWKKLSEANSALEMHLKTLSKLAEINIDDYKRTIIKCSTVTSENVLIYYSSFHLIESEYLLYLALVGKLMVHTCTGMYHVLN